MQRFEYLEIVGDSNSGDMRVRYIDGQEQRDWRKGPRIVEFLNQRGAEGWDLVSFTVPGAGPWGPRVYMLRRAMA